MDGDGQDPALEGNVGDRRYRLLDTIGIGGFGSVRRAELLGGSGFKRYVAIKFVTADDGQESDVARRLRDEARILALLPHRNIVRVEDLVFLDGRWGVVMEYVPGADLRTVALHGPMPSRAAAELTREVALALDVAHRALHPETGRPLNIVHRDIKPGNIRITPSGEVRVLDFGVARSELSIREARTQSMRFGSPGYIAPERFDGEDLPASDVFSLGVVLGEIISNTRLDQLAVRPDRFKRQVGELLQRVPRSAQVLSELLEEMLSYEAERRPSAADVARRLRDIAPTGEGPWLSDWAELHIAPLVNVTIPPADDREPPANSSSSLAPDTEERWEQLVDSDGGLYRAGGLDEHQLPAEPTSDLFTVAESLAAQDALTPRDPALADEPGTLAPPEPLGSLPSMEDGPEGTTEDIDGPEAAQEPARDERPDLRPLLWLSAVALVVGLSLLWWWSMQPVPPPLETTRVVEQPTTPDLASQGTSPQEPAPQDLPGEAAPDQGPLPPVEEPKPVQAPPEPVQPPAPKLRYGRVQVQGPVKSASLIGSNGQSYRISSAVPVGVYDVKVTFEGGATVTLQDLVTVVDDKTVQLTCDEIAMLCRAQ